MTSATRPVRNRYAPLCAGLLLCIVTAGCATTPLSELRQPAFDMPQRFDFAGEAPLRQHWWQNFDDPPLNSLVERALTQNFSLRAAYARVSQARAILRSTGADLLPAVSASLEQRATHQSGSDLFTGSTAGNTTGSTAGSSFSFDRDTSSWTESRSLQFSAGYELDLWGRLRNTRAAAALDERAQQAALQSAAISLAGDIASDWYQLQELRARIELLQSQIETNENVLDLTTYAFTHGQAQAADVLRQRQAVESVRGQLEQTRASTEVARHALAVLVGVAPEHFAAPPGQLARLPGLPDTGVPAALLMRRPDVRQQFFALAAADRRVAVAVADRYPQLTLSASLSTTDDSAALFSNWITQLAAQLTQPLFDGGARAAEVERTKAVVSEEVADYQQTLLESLQEVEDALTNGYRQKRYLARLDKQLALSRQTVANLRLRYLRGATDYLDVLDALLTHQQLQVDRLTGQRQLLNYRINLYRALAGGLDDTPLAGQPPVRASTQPEPARNDS